MQFRTAEYKEKRNAYENLKNQLAKYVKKDIKALASVSQMLGNAAKEELSPTNGSLPNQDVLGKYTELKGEVQGFSRTQDTQVESLYYASTVAVTKYNQYSELYQAEKVKEKAYYAEEAKKAAEKARKAKEDANK